MLLPRLVTLLFAAGAARAAGNTSPFFLLSSEPLPSNSPLQSSQIALSTTVEDRLIETLSSCDKKWYYIIHQDGVSANDLESMSKLRAQLKDATDQRLVEIPQVVADGAMSRQSIEQRLEQACEARGKIRSESVDGDPETHEDAYAFISVTQSPSEVPEGATTGRRNLAETENDLAQIAAKILDGKTSAALIYVSTSSPLRGVVEEAKAYEMDEPYPDALHTDLKRDTGLHRRQPDDEDMQHDLPLFERYQFLSPPIFMGLGVSVLLLSILLVGVYAISGLDVSYMAFNKEMGPQAQKPKQQ